jgi:LPS export ABC transporter protein LptC
VVEGIIYLKRWRKKTLVSIALAALLIVLVTAALFFWESKKVSPEAMLKILSDKADFEVKNVLYREVGDGKTKWEIRADRASYKKKENQAFFDKVELKLYMSGRTYIMTGDKGRLDTATRDMEITGNVGINAGSGAHFATDYLQYSHAGNRLHTGAAVVMQTPRMRISGVGMTLSLENKDLALLSKVRAQIR